MRFAGVWSAPRFHHLTQSLIPIAAAGVFLGLSANTVTLLHADGLAVPMLQPLRAAFLAGATMWSMSLAWRIAGQWTTGLWRLPPILAVTACTLLQVACWIALFWIW